MSRRSMPSGLTRGWIRFADKDMRQHENRRRFLIILDHGVIQYDQEAP
jgi:hypothetical protein